MSVARPVRPLWQQCFRQTPHPATPPPAAGGRARAHSAKDREHASAQRDGVPRNKARVPAVAHGGTAPVKASTPGADAALYVRHLCPHNPIAIGYGLAHRVNDVGEDPREFSARNVARVRLPPSPGGAATGGSIPAESAAAMSNRMSLVMSSEAAPVATPGRIIVLNFTSLTSPRACRSVKHRDHLGQVEAMSEPYGECLAGRRKEAPFHEVVDQLHDLSTPAGGPRYVNALETCSRTGRNLWNNPSSLPSRSPGSQFWPSAPLLRAR